MKKINEDANNSTPQEEIKASNENKNNSEEHSSSNNKNNESKEGATKVSGFARAMPLILWAVAIFLALCFITEETGSFGKFISESFKGLFSYVAYIIPLLIATHAIFLRSDLEKKRLASRIIFSILALITLSQLAYLIPMLIIGAESLFEAEK